MLQIDVPDTELLELDQDRDIFPLEGMPCSIPGCDTSISYLRVSKISWIIGKPDMCQLFQYMYVRCAHIDLRHIPMP